MDTVEDDTKYPLKEKLELLRQFDNKIQVRDFKVPNCPVNPNTQSEKYYRDLMENFDKVVDVYLSLDPKYQLVIKDITHKMGNGMADFIEKEVDTVDEYNLYCHYVAGLVGQGLTSLFVEARLESINLESTNTASNNMGLFLQKTNIIRDYFEDIVEDRVFWPKKIWSLYADDITDFKDPKNIKNAVSCLNHLVADALLLIPDCLQYMSLLKNQQIFNFCAIPQVMAIATLAEIYNNPDVFRKNVKIRKGLTCKLMMETKDIGDVARIFHYFLQKLEAKVDRNDPTSAMILDNIKKAKHEIKDFGVMTESTPINKKGFAVATVATVAVAGIAIWKGDAIWSVVKGFLSKK